ncbi:ferrochelatase [Neokomagataea thailandica]|uniref:Ferrochelatase n=1 Tax=Neokomagataea tanensis NBRC 106556 TaxID=1223519 RepID=A0ABQ0QH45_9PROT|nr:MULTISPECIES: ferrochelatase [Neokomagataea]GBR44589.1 ferrochelatase [Neokomagataea tanensis NBRC 106556]
MAFIYRTPCTAIPKTGRTGVLLVNLGTPDDTGYWAVRRYLSEFLSDRRVIEAPSLLWQPILQGPVLARRPFASGANYARIWDREQNASPLRVYTQRQAELLKERFKQEDVPVAWGMRYGKPSIAQAVDELMDQGCDRIISLPLYPQYSATTTATANDQLFRALMRLRGQPSVLTVPSFPDHPLFIKGLEESVRRTLGGLSFKPQRLVVSFHGLPKICVDKGDRYREECERTTTALRSALDLRDEQMPLTFQSRFGPMEWLQPYTSEFVSKLPEQGVTRIAVITPGFMADCIETLDEIGNELREEFVDAGGEEFALVPCLNDDVAAIDLIEALTRQALKGFAA